ncbi:hypothetical protein KL918_003056 [Ogataea parapolymorpha]|nr:hypothetical protein KL918_003056 [Ogataea parapolymorpha]KAG7871191.1 hypothetical protein KL916_004190 [Ogataea parapolymorpha]
MIRALPRIAVFRACWAQRSLFRFYHNVPKTARIVLDQQDGPEDGLPDSALNPADYSSVVKTIPENSPDTKVLYTLSARYFPLNLKVSIFDTLKSKSIPAKNVLFVITFADQVLDRPLERDADLQTLRESYWRSLNSYLSLYSSQTVDLENVMVTSTKYPRSLLGAAAHHRKQRLPVCPCGTQGFCEAVFDSPQRDLCLFLFWAHSGGHAGNASENTQHLRRAASPAPAERVILGTYQFHSDPCIYV